MNLTKSKLLLVSAALVFICLFLFFIKMDKNELVSSHPGIETGNLKTVRITKIGQDFKVENGLKQFNTISVAIFNPGNKPIVCNFFLRTKKNGRMIFQGKMRLANNTGLFNTEKITFPTVKPSGREDFYFELESPRAYNVQVYSDSPSIGQDNLLFRVSDQQRLPLFSYITQITDHKTQVLCFFLFICAASGLISAVFLLGSDNKRRTSILVIIFLAVFIFSSISVSFVIGNNTHARLLGAEDDAYITYKYARNIAAGNGFTFNSGEKILGTTTPFYTLILAFFGAIAGNIHIFSLLLSFISILASGILIYLLLADHMTSYIALAGGVLFIFFPMFYRVLGMETNFLILLIIASLYFFTRERTNLSFFILGLAVITRMEILIIPPILILVLLFKKKFRPLLTGMGIFTLTILPWFLFSFYYFGNFFPNTFYAKTYALKAQGSALPNIDLLINRILTLKFLKSLFLNSFISYLPDYIQSFFIWIFIFAAAFFASLKSLFRVSFLWLYSLWIGLYILALAVLNVSPFIWYYIIPLSVIPIILPAPLSHLKGRLGRNISVLIVMGLVIFAGSNIFNIFYSHWYTRHMTHLERYTTFEHIAEYMQKNIPQENSIAMEEIGITAYSIDNKICDAHYLIHDISYLPPGFSVLGPNRIPILLNHMQPDYILFHSGRLSQSAYYYQNYSTVKVFPVNIFALKPTFYYVLMKSKEKAEIKTDAIELSLPSESTATIW